MNSASGWEGEESFTEQVVGMNGGHSCQGPGDMGRKGSEFWLVLRIQWVGTCKRLETVPGLRRKPWKKC